MAFRFACECGQPYTAERDQIGNTFKCTACGAEVRVPDREDSDDTPALGTPAVPSGSDETWLHYALMLGLIALAVMVALSIRHERRRQQEAERAAKPEVPVSSPDPERRPDRPAATESGAAATPTRHERTMRPVMRGYKGVQVKRRHRDGPPELIVDPFPGDEPRKRRKAEPCR